MKKGLRRMYIAFLSPVVIAFLVAYLYPVLRTVQMSFFKVSDISAARETWEFVGLFNYMDLFSRQLFRVSFRNMILIFLVGGIFVFSISLFFAWVLHKGMFMSNFWRNVIYLPTVITPVAMITVWTQYVYNNRYGLLKTIFDALGLEKVANIPWTSTQYAFWSMLIAFVFCSIGGNLLVYMAAMKKVPEELYEAAFIDGATEGKAFFKITLPLIMDNIKTQVTFWVIGCIGFFLWSRVFSVVPSDPTTITPASYMYDQIFGTSISANAVAGSTNVGMGAAIGVVLCIVTVIALAVINAAFPKEKYEI
jgi:multiple sugar transport system permease protein/N-acetylglucosamine transport system permease protein